MILYPLISNLVFSAWQLVAGKNSWISKVGSDASWKSSGSLEGKVIWMHAASLGEFEMGRPVLELFLDKHPDWNAVVTFFSPSGYEPRKSYARAKVHYLPLDTPSQASKWLDYANPSLAVFVRYDLWPNHLNALRKRGVPTVVIAMSASKTPWYLHRLLPFIRKVYKEGVHSWGVIAEQDAAIMSLAGIHSEVLGNPKYDYAASLVGKTPSQKYIDWKKAQNKPILLVGSAHLEDCRALNDLDLKKFSIWIVPHEIDQSDVLKGAMTQFKTFDSANSMTDDPKETSLLMVPEFGVLTGLYSLADGVIIGGGYAKATHNVLEATAQGKIAASGPNWQKIAENHELVKRGYLFPIQSTDQYSQYLERIGTTKFIAQGNKAQKWLLGQKGASQKILKVLEQAVQL